MLADTNILVTGAGGFIGGWIVESLYLDGYSRVHAGVHNWSGAVRIARFPVKIVPCNILDLQQASEAIDGVTCVIHCAKGTNSSIVEGTRNLLNVCLEKGVKRFVYISSTEVYGNAIGSFDENYACKPTGNTYGDSKITAENLCWEYHKKGLPVTIIRPPIVFGPFSKTWTVAMAQRLRSGNWRVYRHLGEGRCNLVYISDLVSGVISAAASEKAIGEVFNMNGSEVITWNEYFARFNQALALPALQAIKPENARLRSTMIEPVRTIAKYARDKYERQLKLAMTKYGPLKNLAKYLEKTIKTVPRTTDFDLYNRNATYVDDKARRILGYMPTTSLETGLRYSVAWLDQVGLLNP